MILDAGDLFFTSHNLNASNKKSEIYRAGAMLEGYGRIGYDAINVGQYETLIGLPFLNKMVEKTEIPFVSANLRDAKTKNLLFDPFRIVEKGGLKIGIIGVTDNLPDTSKTMVADDYIEVGNQYIDELSKQADIVVIMVNSDRGTHSELPTHFANADFIVTSGSTNLTRPNSTQKKGGPYLYSCGKQGKYLLVLNLDIKNSADPIVDISAHEHKLVSIKKRFERLQRKNPDKPLEENYAGQTNVLKLIEGYRDELRVSEAIIQSAVNKMEYKTVALNKKIQDNIELLAFVDESLATCSSLKTKTAQFPKTKPGIKKKRD